MTQSSIDQGAPSVVVNKPRGRPFVKGQPRPQGSGRKKGTQGKVVTEIRQFFRDLLDGEAFREHVRQRFESGTILDSPHLYATIVASAIGKSVPAKETEDTSRPPLLFVTMHKPGEYDPLAAKAAMLAARKAERALPEKTAEAFTPPKGDEPAGEALEIVDPGSIAERLMRPK